MAGKGLDNVQPPPNPARRGNLRAVKDGTYSETLLAPLRAEQDAELRRDYPELDDRRRAILADRLSRLGLGWKWLDEHGGGGIVRGVNGDIFPIVDRCEQWGAKCEQIIGQLEADRRAREQDVDEFARYRQGRDE
jgi:hypothetical protein